jgi:hypothetical protein
MTASIDFTDQARQNMGALRVVPVDLDPQLARIEVEGGTIAVDLFRTDKLEKVVFCTIMMHETGVVESTAMAWPDDNHHLPILWCNLTIVPEVMNVPIFDFVPMMDIVVWPDYAERYIAGVSTLRDNALELLGDAVTDKAVNLPSLSVYTLSPYCLVAKVTDEGVEKIPAVLNAYIGAYITLWEKASRLDDGPEKQFYLTKKAATRKLMKANDPGYAFMIDVFGKESTKKVFDSVF